MTRDHGAAKRFPWLQYVKTARQSNEIIFERGVIGWGGNSGFQALNLAVQFGATRIALVGYDMTTAHGLHWHGSHERGLSNPTAKSTASWRGILDSQAARLAAAGIEVINTSPVSALENYRRAPLSDLFPPAP